MCVCACMHRSSVQQQEGSSLQRAACNSVSEWVVANSPPHKSHHPSIQLLGRYTVPPGKADWKVLCDDVVCEPGLAEEINRQAATAANLSFTLTENIIIIVPTLG